MRRMLLLLLIMMTMTMRRITVSRPSSLLRMVMATMLLLVEQSIITIPPPSIVQSSSSLRTDGRSILPNYATLSSPISGQRFYRRQPITIRFLDPEVSATEAQFSLSNRTGLFLIGKSPLRNGQVIQQINLPNWVADGTYDFVVSEDDGSFGSDTFNIDVIICTIYVGKPKKNRIESLDFLTLDSPHHDHYRGDQANHHPLDHPKSSSQSYQNKDLFLTKREPHPPRFLNPTTNQFISTGHQFLVHFLDGQLSPGVDKARFVLRSSKVPMQQAHLHNFILTTPNGAKDGLQKFDGVQIQVNLTIPKKLTPGTYLLLAQEFHPDGPSSEQQYEDATSITVRIVAAQGHQTALKGSDEGPDADKLERRGSFLMARSSAASSQASVQSSRFNSPTKYQRIITGHHLNISFVHTNVNSRSQKIRFILRQIGSNVKQTDLILFSRNAQSELLFQPQNSTLNVRVFFPQGIQNGNYSLVAQDCTLKDALRDLGIVQIQVQQIRPLPSKKVKRATIQLRNPSQRTVYPLVSPISPSLSSQKLQPVPLLSSTDCNSKYQALVNTNQAEKNSYRDSPSIIEPHSNQNVPRNSKFWCKVEDHLATSESVQFVLRSFGGLERYLGTAKFVKGIAALQATCPNDLQVDTYYVVARMNSIKKPKTFLDVISTSIIVSHQTTAFNIINSGEPQTIINPISTNSAPPKLIKPYYNQNIRAGEEFECQIQNGENHESVKFLLHLHDGRPDMLIGSCEMAQNFGKTMCQIPSSVTPGTYILVAQKNSKLSPQQFKEAGKVTISVMNPRGFGPDFEKLDQDMMENHELDERSLKQIEPLNRSNSHQNVNPVPTLIQPSSFQAISTGQEFQVRLNNNMLTLSTMYKFFIRKSLSTSNQDNKADQDYLLGMSSHAPVVEETLRCPDNLQSGTYLFVIQGNDPKDPKKFSDLIYNPISINNKNKIPNHSSNPSHYESLRGKGDTKDLNGDQDLNTIKSISKATTIMNGKNYTNYSNNNNISNTNNYTNGSGSDSIGQEGGIQGLLTLPTSNTNNSGLMGYNSSTKLINDSSNSIPIIPPRTVTPTSASITPTMTMTKNDADNSKIVNDQNNIQGLNHNPQFNSGDSLFSSNNNNNPIHSMNIDRSSTPLGSGNVFTSHSHSIIFTNHKFNFNTFLNFKPNPPLDCLSFSILSSLSLYLVSSLSLSLYFLLN